MLKLKSTKLDLQEIVWSGNIAEMIDEHDLGLIAQEVCSKALEDKQSRYEWEQLVEEILRTVDMRKMPKDTPFVGASNAKYPLTINATLHYAAAMYPEIIRQGEVAHMFVVGNDPTNYKHQIAQAITDHTNYQLLVEDGEYETNLDKLLTTYSLVGVMFKKTYYDPTLQKIRSELVPYTNIYVNKNIDSIESPRCRRITHVIPMHTNDILEKIRYDLYQEVDVDQLQANADKDDGQEEHTVYEQHCFLDLDGDGYEEPYIVTVLDKTKEVLRIFPRFNPDGIKYTDKGKVKCITPIHYFTDFHFLPNPDGSYYSIGFGHLLYHINNIANSLFNNMIDAGTLANNPPGFIDGSVVPRLPGGEMEIGPGKVIKLNTSGMTPIGDSFKFLEYPQPGPVMLNLITMLLESGKELASITEPETGQAQVQNVARDVMASQLANGARLQKGITRRLYRSIKSELEKYYRNNAMFLEPQEQFLVPGQNRPLTAEDYKEAGIMVKPVADPNMSSDMERANQSTLLLQLSEHPTIGPVISQHGVAYSVLESHKIENIESIVIPPDQMPQDPEALRLQGEFDAKAKELQLAAQKLALLEKEGLVRGMVADKEIEKLDAEIVKAKAEARLADAKAYEAYQSPGIAKEQIQANAIITGMKGELDLQKEHVKAKAKPKPSGDKK